LPYFKYTKSALGEGKEFDVSPFTPPLSGKKGYHESKIVFASWIVEVLLSIVSIVT
jgi:hypothetical protein